MHMTRSLAALLVLCCELCLAIRVPVAWDNGDVQKDTNEQFSVEAFKPQNENPVPIEYFEYTANKPQFAIDIAASHGVKSPENHYKAYPVRPHTKLERPKLGIHHILDEDKKVFQPIQEFAQNEGQRYITPVLSNYEVFHPYKAEEPALDDIYRDPVMNKIRNDLEDTKNRLQKYEKEAGEEDIKKEEYLESPEQTDKKLFPHKNVPAQFEIHRPQRRPVYYRLGPKLNHRDQILNQKFRHPWNQHFVKVRPMHYRPLKNHIHNLRQHHALQYDDERNEYPQIQVSQNFAEPQDGYDIYEKGKEKYEQLRDNVDESINKAVQENRPIISQNLELQNDETNDNDDEEEEFVPIKNYAQVRKTETYKHLPKSAAFDDAETYEEIRNAPRLREAVKSTKAQTVYTEEGYEDSAYDHAGEQKHASDHEGHGGYLKQKEISGGKYKTPSLSNSFDDGKGSEYRDQVLHGEKWKNNDKDNQEESEVEDFSEDEQEQLIEAKTYRNKRENDSKNITDTELKLEDVISESNVNHEVDKRQVNFEVPELDLNSTFLSEKEILQIAKQKVEPKKDDIKEKYPYYFNNLKSINKHSPLRYAENLKLIPKKSNGGTEFYDSRSSFECPEIEDVDPLPDQLKNGEKPNNEEDKEGTTEQKSNKGEKNFDTVKQQPRLRGLGDKIDCFKAKYFGENPLDSPFFKEEIILSPEPVTAPNILTYKLKPTELSTQESKINNALDIPEKLQNDRKIDIFVLLDKLRTDQGKQPDLEVKTKVEHKLITHPSQNITNNSTFIEQSNVYSDILSNNKNNESRSETEESKSLSDKSQEYSQSSTPSNVTYNYFLNKEDVTKVPVKLSRKKRATPFVYEPYKIIRDGQIQESKKTTTTSNISPLIKQMQTSRVVDRVTRANQEPDKQVKRYVSSRTYKDIGKNDRTKSSDKGNEGSSDSSFVDVNIDKRRGEPRYELRPSNHKSEYTPVENKTSISVEDYNAQVKNEKSSGEPNSQGILPSRRNSRQRRPTVKPVFDVSEYLPSTTEGHNVAASNTIKRTVTTTTQSPSTITPSESSEDDSEDDYEEYDDNEEDEETTTTTTTKKPTIRIRRISTTTENYGQQKNTPTEMPKLKLVTRFRNYKPEEVVDTRHDTTEKMFLKNKGYEDNDEALAPKFREKKRKSTKSTIVTDSKKYGDGDGYSDSDDNNDSMRKEEVDALIGVKHDMNDYIPLYEKEADNKYRSNEKSSEEHDEDYDDDDDDDDDDEDDVDNDDEDDEDDEEEEDELEPKVTTPEPTKRTLLRTTDAPTPTVASRSAKLELKPVISKKKIEIHKELPVNNSSPHLSQFKQDIEEVEIIKEIPRSKKKPQKNTEALELYKDDNLAQEINKLKDVEIFMENLDLKNGPRHGGNYKSAMEEPISSTPSNEDAVTPKDTVASQSENTKHIELDDHIPKRLHGGNLKSLSEISRSRNSARNSKLIELRENEGPPRAMHGGNLKFDSKTRRGNRRNEKLIELDGGRDDEDDSVTESNYKKYSTRNGQAMHGGNYRSAKIVQGDNKDKENSEHDIRARPNRAKDARRNAALLLNNFAQAVPILTTTPGYILDPSKRMYYYVET